MYSDLLVLNYNMFKQIFFSKMSKFIWLLKHTILTLQCYLKGSNKLECFLGLYIGALSHESVPFLFYRTFGRAYATWHNKFIWHRIRSKICLPPVGKLQKGPARNLGVNSKRSELLLLWRYHYTTFAHSHFLEAILVHHFPIYCIFSD